MARNDIVLQQGDGVDGFSALAQKRREDAQVVDAQPLPSYILRVSSSEVTTTYEISAIPLQHIDPQHFLDLMRKAYGVTLEPLKLDPLIQKLSLEEVRSMDSTELLSRSLELPDFDLHFVNGRWPTKYEFVEIHHIIVDYESIFVKVQGKSSVAEAVISEVLEFLWESASAPKKASDLEELTMLVSYVSSTQVDLGMPAINLVAPNLRELLQGGTDGKANFAGKMGPRSHRDGFAPPTRIAASISLDEIDFQVHRFNMETGASYRAFVKVGVTSRDDAGTSRVRFMTHLPYDDHVEFVQDFINSISR